MNKHLKIIPVILAKFVFLFGQAHAGQELGVGTPAPDFNLKDQHNKTHTLKDYKEQWLVLYFYPRDDTPGCTKEACNFRDDIIHIKALKASVMGVSLDDSRSNLQRNSIYPSRYWRILKAKLRMPMAPYGNWAQ